MVLYEKGYQLVEVLIALLILMIAVTTIGGVEIFSLKNNRHSSHHITALSLLQDISDSMRANAKATNNERYATRFSQTIPESKKCINTNDTCSSAELAQSELALWKKNIKDTFFQGEGEIIFTFFCNFSTVAEKDLFFLSIISGCFSKFSFFIIFSLTERLLRILTKSATLLVLLTNDIFLSGRSAKSIPIFPKKLPKGLFFWGIIAEDSASYTGLSKKKQLQHLFR